MPTALVTGASRGLGQAIANQFVSQGWDVLTPDRKQLDLLSPESIRRWCAASEPKALDALVHSAGVNWPTSIAQTTDAQWADTFQINLNALRILVQELLPRLTQPQGGRILALSSIFSLVNRPGRATYSSTKAAVNAFIRGLAVELAPHGILANALCPGYIDTDLTRQNNSPEQIAAIEKTIPLGRLGLPNDIAPLAVWLCSNANTYLTGQAIVLDGGFTCQ